MGYGFDRAFTNKVHQNLAVPIIYNHMNWVVQDNMNSRLSKAIDMGNAVDYIAIDMNGAPKIVTIQERFREEKYENYSDFTVRYQRPENSHEDRRLSEYFKLDADYFIYGIINTSKTNVDNATRFKKYAVLDLRILKEKIDDGAIIIDGKMSGTRCREERGIMRCPINSNVDHSSTFVPFDIEIMNRIAPDVIVYQEGFVCSCEQKECGGNKEKWAAFWQRRIRKFYVRYGVTL